MTCKPPGLGLIVTPLSPEHLEQVTAIEKVSFSQPWPRRLFEAQLHHSSALPLTCLGLSSRRVLGYICLWLTGDVVQVQNFAVHHKFRRRGVGRLLLTQALQEASLRGGKLATLEVRPSNTAARRLYASLSFREVGRRPGYYPLEGEDALLLRCSLSSLSLIYP